MSDVYTMTNGAMANWCALRNMVMLPLVAHNRTCCCGADVEQGFHMLHCAKVGCHYKTHAVVQRAIVTFARNYTLHRTEAACNRGRKR